MKPYIKDEDFDDKQRERLYGVSQEDFFFVATPEEADIGILPMTWNYYVQTGRLELAFEFINSPPLKEKKIFVFNAGDFGLKIPFFTNAVVFRLGGYSNRFGENEKVIPPFIEDPLGFGKRKFILRKYKKRPTIGFCGQANFSRIKAVKEIAIAGWRNFKFFTGRSQKEPQQLIPTSYLRAHTLKKLKDSSLVETNFIFRKKYRAGVKLNKEIHSTSQEFLENIISTDYTVCLRGVGNFSVRFYETLAMGRIPIYVNTKGVLPLEDKIEWKNHVVWIEKEDIPNIAEMVERFHRNLSAESFEKIQEGNRQLWMEYLSLKGFFNRMII